MTMRPASRGAARPAVRAAARVAQQLVAQSQEQVAGATPSLRFGYFDDGEFQADGLTVTSEPTLVPDHDGILREHSTNVLPVPGARMVRNYIPSPMDVTGGGWVYTGGGSRVDYRTVTFTAARGTAWGTYDTLYLLFRVGSSLEDLDLHKGRRHVCLRIKMSGTPGETIQLILQGDGGVGSATNNRIRTITLTATPTWYSVDFELAGIAPVYAPDIFINRTTAHTASTVYIDGAQLEDRTGSTNPHIPSEFISAEPLGAELLRSAAAAAWTPGGANVITDEADGVTLFTYVDSSEGGRLHLQAAGDVLEDLILGQEYFIFGEVSTTGGLVQTHVWDGSASDTLSHNTSGTWTYFSHQVTINNATSCYFRINALSVGETLSLRNLSIRKASPATKYFDYESANTIDANGVVTDARGADITGDLHALVVPETTNELANSNNLTGLWTYSNVTITANVEAQNGHDVAFHIADSGDGYLFILGSTQGHSRSIWARSPTGQGTKTVSLMAHNTHPEGQVTITEEWQEFKIEGGIAGTTGAANFYAVDFRYGTATEVEVHWPQSTDTAVCLPYVETISAPVTRTAMTVASTGSFNDAEGSVALAWVPGLSDYTGVDMQILNPQLLYAHSVTAYFYSYDGNTFTMWSLSPVADTPVALGLRWSAAEGKCWMYRDGVMVLEFAYDGAWVAGVIKLFAFSANNGSEEFSNFRIWDELVTDAQMITETS